MTGGSIELACVARTLDLDADSVPLRSPPKRPRPSRAGDGRSITSTGPRIVSVSRRRRPSHPPSRRIWSFETGPLGHGPLGSNAVQRAYDWGLRRPRWFVRPLARCSMGVLPAARTGTTCRTQIRTVELLETSSSSMTPVRARPGLRRHQAIRAQPSRGGRRRADISHVMSASRRFSMNRTSARLPVSRSAES